jgi:hypothetical protein
MQQGIDTKLFANARGMTATQAFDVVPDDNRDNRRCYWSTIPRPYQNGPCRDEYELPARPQHLVPHGEIKRRPIEAGIVPTDEEHQQRRKRWDLSANGGFRASEARGLSSRCIGRCL